MFVLPFTQYLFAKNKTAFDVSDVDDFMEEHRDYHRKQDYQRDKFLRIVEAVNRRQRKPSKDFYYHDSKDLYRSWLRRTNAMEPELGDDTDKEETDTAKEKTTDKDELTGTREGEATGAGLWAKCAAAAASGCSTQIASKCIDGLVYAGQTAFRATREAAADQPAAAVTKGPEINLGPVRDSTKFHLRGGRPFPNQPNEVPLFQAGVAGRRAVAPLHDDYRADDRDDDRADDDNVDSENAGLMNAYSYIPRLY